MRWKHNKQWPINCNNRAPIPFSDRMKMRWPFWPAYKLKNILRLRRCLVVWCCVERMSERMTGEKNSPHIVGEPSLSKHAVCYLGSERAVLKWLVIEETVKSHFGVCVCVCVSNSITITLTCVQPKVRPFLFQPDLASVTATLKTHWFFFHSFASRQRETNKTQLLLNIYNFNWCVRWKNAPHLHSTANGFLHLNRGV